MTEQRTLYRSYQFVLQPTPAQVQVFEQYAGVVRLVYNLALEQRKTFWRQYHQAEGRHISFASQSREVTALRREFPWAAAVHTDATTAALRDLDLAYRGFFAGRSGYPTFRNKAANNSFRLRGDGDRTAIRKLNAKWSEIRLRGIGWVKYRRTRDIETIQTVTVALCGGRWSMAIVTTCAAKESAPPGAVGIDRGIANTIALSTGELRSLPASLTELERRRKRAQQALSRKRRGSGRYRLQRARVAALGNRIAAIRSDWIHRQSVDIARRFDTVALEALKLASMTRSAAGTAAQPGTGVAQKRGLNRSILAQGWGMFAAQLAYKLEERGGRLVYVNPAYTSQTCSACGVVDAESRKSQAVFHCTGCGHEEHADIGAAKEILRRSTALLDVEGSRWRPVEASTEGVAA